MSLESIARRLGRAIGLDPDSLGPVVFGHGVERRMKARAISDLSLYAKLLEQSPVELQELIEEVVVGESWFFRQPGAFELLRDEVKSHGLLGNKYHVASIPCAAGEEPYTIAITLLEAGLRPSQIHIDAADVSRVAIERARQGIYSARALREVSRERRARFFQTTGEKYAVLPEVRECVEFHRLNLIDLPAESLRGPYQGVFCRNLLIYLTAEARERLLNRLDAMLANDGLLFLGHAEQIEALGRRFVRVDRDGAFAYRRVQANVVMPRSVSQHSRAKTSIRSRPTSRPTATSPLQKTAAKPPADDPLARAAALAQAQRFDEAIEICRAFIEGKGPSACAFQTLGMIHQMRGRLDDAEAAFERAVYLDPRCDESLLALALLARRRGDSVAARRYEQRARRAGMTSADHEAKA